MTSRRVGRSRSVWRVEHVGLLDVRAFCSRVPRYGTNRFGRIDEVPTDEHGACHVPRHDRFGSTDSKAVKARSTADSFSRRLWLEVAGIKEGVAFRPVDRHGHIGVTRLSPQAVALVVKRRGASARLDPSEVSGHPLRAGLATSAAAAGVPERVIAEQTGHKGTAMLRRYIREGYRPFPASQPHWRRSHGTVKQLPMCGIETAVDEI